MAIYKRTYRAYTGPLTPAWSRFWILTRYAWKYLFRSRFMTVYFILCFFPAIVMVCGLYLNHNETLLKLFRMSPGQTLISDLATYFRNFLLTQVALAMFLTAFSAPSLISPDLTNNALPLYFCRPFSRTEYLLGKFCVVGWLVSLITWVPGLIMFGVEAGLSGASWAWHNWWIAAAIFVGSAIYAVVLSLVGLSLSAWVKWKPIAGALVLGTFFVGAGLGAATNAIMRTKIGYYLDIGHMLSIIWAFLFRAPDYDAGVPVVGAIVQLCAVCAFCLWLLYRKTRAFEVIR